MAAIDPIRLLLVDDHLLLREALSRVLSSEPDFAIAAECASVEEALRIVEATKVDMVLLDINLETEQGGAFLNRAGTVGYCGKVLAVTAGVGEREAAWLLQRGCSGIFLKDAPVATLVAQIRSVMKGDAPLDAMSVKALVSLAESARTRTNLRLTTRESQVLRHVCEGLANKEIAQQMDLSESSVKSFIQQLFAKAGVRSRAQLVAAAIEHYWDQLDHK